MLYPATDDILIRTMQAADADIFCREETAQGWHPTGEKHRARLADAAQGKCIALAAEYCGQPAGYVSVYFTPADGPYAQQDICCIVDFAVLEKYRRRGIGTRLMDAAEALAAQRGNAVCLAVGLHSGYGAAQKMYVRRGYLPDGSGIWYNGAPCQPYTPCTNDDDLVLHMYKLLRSEP